MTVLYTLKDHFKESQLFLNRTVAATTLSFILTLVLLVRLAFLQIHQNELYSTLSFTNQVRILPLTPPRGLIYDRNGILLAENTPAFSLTLIKDQVTDIPHTLERLKKLLYLRDSELEHFYKQAKYKRRYEPITIRSKLSEDDVAAFSLDKDLFPGVEITATLTRRYPFGESFAHVLGYISPISEKDLPSLDASNYRGTYHMGKSGLEKYYETLLHGTVGYQHVETDARGRVIRVLDKVAPIRGQELHLALDSRLQIIAHEALKDEKGAVVVLDPRNGDVLALVSQPSFDPNLFAQGIDNDSYQELQKSPSQPLYNRAIRGQYPPASTVKPMIALHGLQLGTATTEQRIFDPGWFQLNSNDRYYRCVKRHGHGWVDLQDAIMKSCDTYFYMLAHKLSVNQLQTVFTRFGLGQSTGLDIVGESTGLVPSKDWKKKSRNQSWYPGETLNIGIGQGYMLATPLQVAQMTAMIAKRGQRFQPRLNTSLQVSQPPLDEYSAENWNIIIDAMKKVVHDPSGTAHYIAHDLDYKIAGKTGTAQVYSLKQDERYDRDKIKAHLRDHSWFIGFAPADDPSIVVAVLIENNKGSANVARLVMDTYFGKKTRPLPAPQPVLAAEPIPDDHVHEGDDELE